MSKRLSCSLFNLIRWHSFVHEAVKKDRKLKNFDRIAVLLSWADERGRIHSPFDSEVENTEKAFERIWSEIDR